MPPLPPQLEQRVNWGWQDFFRLCHPCHPKIHFHFGDFFLFARKSDGVRGDCRLSLAGIIINIGRAPEPYTPYFLLPIACHSERVGRSQGRPQGRPQERPQGRPQGRPAALNDILHPSHPPPRHHQPLTASALANARGWGVLKDTSILLRNNKIG